MQKAICKRPPLPYSSSFPLHTHDKKENLPTSYNFAKTGFALIRCSFALGDACNHFDRVAKKIPDHTSFIDDLLKIKLSRG